jgi:hypothetical protein
MLATKYDHWMQKKDLRLRSHTKFNFVGPFMFVYSTLTSNKGPTI